MIAALLFAVLLPDAPKPAVPFPKIVSDAATITPVAPGVAYGDYQMLTLDGPLWVHVVAVDLREPTIRIGTVLAHNQLVSPGEPLSSMAHRTAAVAGINGDYFDINQTNQPLNILIEDGRLRRMPMHRWAIAFDQTKTPAFAEFSIQAYAQISTMQVPLKTINDWPPPGGGAVFITPDYGAIRPIENVTELSLQPVTGSPPFASYRVTSIADNTAAQPSGYYLAIGPNAYGTFSLPNPGDSIAITAQAQPPISNLQSALGGGPLLVQNGAWFADPDGPSSGEFATHMPASGVATTADGRLLFFEIDGRQPALSIGVLQPQFAALMIAFGATTGMQLDGGGSSELVARLPGDTGVTVRNSPSDGMERNIADGLFVYSSAPTGPPANLVAYPQTIRALPGARVAVRFATIDKGDHPASDDLRTTVRVEPASLGSYSRNEFIAHRLGIGALQLRHGALRLNVPVDVTNAVARAQILPANPVAPAGGSLHFSAAAFDRDGFAIALPARLAWKTQQGVIDSTGSFQANTSNTVVSVQLGSLLAKSPVIVGEHPQALRFVETASFAAAPRDGPGNVSQDVPCAHCLTLAYDFSGDERAAYANVSLPLPERALGIRLGVFGDGHGETLRVAVNNAIGERFMYTIAKVDWRGWRPLNFRFPAELPQPLTLKSIYVLNRIGTELPVAAAGSVAFRNVTLILAGSADKLPK